MSNLPNERARFEAWAEQPGGIGRTWRSTEPGYEDTYGDSHTQIAWRAWQEAVRLEREAAAKACEDFGASYDNEWNRKLGVANDLKDACDECAAAIRARSQEGQG